MKPIDASISLKYEDRTENGTWEGRGGEYKTLTNERSLRLILLPSSFDYFAPAGTGSPPGAVALTSAARSVTTIAKLTTMKNANVITVIHPAA